jgi:phosphatidylglycerophosphate synthase
MGDKPLRVKLQQGIYKVIDPFVKMLIKIGFTPNAVTTTGFILNLGVAFIFVLGGEEGNRGDLSYVGWAGGLILFAGLFDMLDGQVARLGNMSSAFGAMYDSVLDRYSELFMFLGICYYLVAHHYLLSSLFAFIAMIGSMMVSYTRARAEGLGIECKGGLMQRPERVVLIGLAALACGIISKYIGGNYKLYIKGFPFHVFETMSIFTVPITVLAVLTNITAIRRLRDSKIALEKKEMEKKERERKTAAGVLPVILLFLSIGVASLLQATPRALMHELEYLSADSLPVPTGNPKQLFYLQRTPNSNTIVCELNLKEDGSLNTDNPVHVFWIRYAEKGQRQELNFIQRTFAYGIKSKALDGGKYELHFVCYKKYKMYLTKSAVDNKYHAYGYISKKMAIINRMYIKVNGGSFWSPNVEYVQLDGVDPATGAPLMERIKVAKEE